MIEVQIIGAEKVEARFKGAGLKMRAEILKTITSLSIQLQRYVKEKKLSGASPNAKAGGSATGVGKYAGQALGVRTGRLRRSITQVVKESGNEITGTVGTNVEYGRVHEYGFSGTVPVRAHVRNARNGSAAVRAHSRAVNIPERSFLRSSLRESKPAIEAALRAAVERGVGE